MNSEVQQSIAVAVALTDQYGELVDEIAAAAARGDADEHSATRAHLERVYTSIWEQLDTAAALTRDAGRSVDDFASIRNRSETREAAVADTGVEVLDVQSTRSHTHITIEHTVHHNGRGRALAVEAAAHLRAAWPELVWTDGDTPDVDLRPGGLSRVIRGIAGLFGRR